MYVCMFWGYIYKTDTHNSEVQKGLYIPFELVEIKLHIVDPVHGGIRLNRNKIR
jgi:hypothetical protein